MFVMFHRAPFLVITFIYIFQFAESFSGNLEILKNIYHDIAGTVYHLVIYTGILFVLDPRKCEYLKDYSLDFEYVYMTTYLAS